MTTKEEKLYTFYKQCLEKNYTDMSDETQALKAKVFAMDLNLRYSNISALYKEASEVYNVVEASMPQLLNPDLTASWEKGLSYVAEGTISPDEYMQKLSAFVKRRTDTVKGITNPERIRAGFEPVLPYYAKKGQKF